MIYKNENESMCKHHELAVSANLCTLGFEENIYCVLRSVSLKMLMQLELRSRDED